MFIVWVWVKGLSFGFNMYPFLVFIVWVWVKGLSFGFNMYPLGL